VDPDDIGVEQYLGLVRRKGFGHASRSHTGVVDEHVDPADLIKDGRDRTIHRTVVGDVELDDTDILAAQRVGVRLAAAIPTIRDRAHTLVEAADLLDFFLREPPAMDEYARDLREQIGLTPDDILILQPTRLVSRKGVEHAIELVRRLKEPRAKLVVSHSAGDEGLDYYQWLRDLAHVEMETAGYLHWFNSRRIHSAIGDVAPAQAEAAWYAARGGEEEQQ